MLSAYDILFVGFAIDPMLHFCIISPSHVKAKAAAQKDSFMQPFPLFFKYQPIPFDIKNTACKVKATATFNNNTPCCHVLVRFNLKAPVSCAHKIHCVEANNRSSTLFEKSQVFICALMAFAVHDSFLMNDFYAKK
jgi:hypothetical protein